MAEKMRNEVVIKLAGQDRVMRATFAAIRGIENDLRTNIVPLLGRFANGDIGMHQTAVVIYNGLKGYEDTRLSVEQIGDAILDTGLNEVMVPVIEFLKVALDGVTLGKSAEAA